MRLKEATESHEIAKRKLAAATSAKPAITPAAQVRGAEAPAKQAARSETSAATPISGLQEKARPARRPATSALAERPARDGLQKQERAERQSQRVHDPGVVGEDEASPAVHEEAKAQQKRGDRETLERRKETAAALEHEPAGDDGGDPVGEQEPERGVSKRQARRRQQIGRQRTVDEIDVAIEKLAVAQTVGDRPGEAPVIERKEPAASGPQTNRRRRSQEHPLRQASGTCGKRIQERWRTDASRKALRNFIRSVSYNR